MSTRECLSRVFQEKLCNRSALQTNFAICAYLSRTSHDAGPMHGAKEARTRPRIAPAAPPLPAENDWSSVATRSRQGGYRTSHRRLPGAGGATKRTHRVQFLGGVSRRLPSKEPLTDSMHIPRAI